MSLFFAPGPSYRPTSTFLTNTFTAGQIFTGSDLGAAGAGEVRIGGGLVRAGVGIIGTDPGGSELLRVGGSMRCQRASINGGYVFADGDIGVARTSSTGGIYFGTANTRYLYYDGTNYNLAGGGMIIGTDPNPGGGEKLRVGGGIFSTAAQTIDLGTGALPAFASPLELLLGAADGQAVRVNGYAHGATGMGIRGFAASGTRSAPTAVNGLGLVVVAGGGYDGSAWQDSATYYIQTADGLWSGTNRGTYHAWVGTPNGSTVAAEWMRLQGGNLGIGVTPSAGNGKIQTPSGTTKADGWAMGDVNIFRAASGSAYVQGPVATDIGWTVSRSTGEGVLMLAGGGVGIIGTSSNHPLWIRSNGTTAITIDTSQNVGIGVTPTAGNGKLQMPAGTAKTDGIGFGGDAFLHREGAAAMRLEAAAFTVKPSSSAANLVVSPSGSGNSAAIEVGQGGSGNRNAYIDLTGDDTYTDYGLRIIRVNSGANANSEIANRGTGALRLISADAGAVEFWTNNISRGNWSSSGVLTVSGTADGILVVNGKITAKAAVPASFADLAAVRAYLASILT